MTHSPIGPKARILVAILILAALTACSDARLRTERGREIQRLCVAALREAKSARDTLTLLVMGANGLSTSTCVDEVLRPGGVYAR